MTTERLFPHPRNALEDVISDGEAENDESNQDVEVEESGEDDTLYSSLKGLEPLVRWAQLKGKCSRQRRRIRLYQLSKGPLAHRCSGVRENHGCEDYR